MSNAKKFFVFNQIALTFAVVLFMIYGAIDVAFAENASKKVDGSSYEMADSTGFIISDSSKVKQLSYGKKSLGELYLQGFIADKLSYDGYTAYSTNQKLDISYHYDNTLQSDNKDEWNLVESDSKIMCGFDLSKKMNKGATIIQKSTNGKDWSTAAVTVDAFGKNRSALNGLYVIEESEIKSGIYYRVMIGYRIGKRTKTQKKLKVITDDVYEYKEILEKYEFYVTYSDNAVKLYDITSGKDISGKKFVEDGFIINKGGSSFDVTVSRNNEKASKVEDLTSIVKPGTYTIEISSQAEKSYSYSIEVTKGLEMNSLTPTVYDGGKKGKYEETDPVNGQTAYGKKSLTTLRIAQRYGKKIGESQKTQFHAFGITGDTACIYMNLTPSLNRDWSIIDDEWGKKDKQMVNDVYVGQVSSGAILIQKSNDGVNWNPISSDSYADGLFTTDYQRHYYNRGDVMIYRPNGKELLKGLYLKISYAYNLRDDKDDSEHRFLEVYNLYLCSNELEAVTVHNLSIEKTLKEKIGEDDEASYEVYKQAETLESGSCTVTGFSIDKALNPTVKYSIKKNGKDFTEPENKKITEDGKYEITLQSAVGDKKSIIIYVDTQKSENSYSMYFGNSFIEGKRVYSENSKFPVYEGGNTNWTILPQKENYLPINGTLKNTNTGKEINISSENEAQKKLISDAGHYIASFSTRPSNITGELSGDYRVFTFEFDIIKEGTAPGPVVNQKSLEQYAKTTISDAYPKYYGVTYPSAHSGYITLAFSNIDDAKQFAYNYEKGKVEKQPDGSYRYNGSLDIGQKKEIESAWDLTDAMNIFAEKAVQELYFDLSDPFTCRTLEQSLIDTTENLRTLELRNSVIIFADAEQRTALCTLKSALPFISPKPYLYQAAGKNGQEKTGFHDFQFVHDKYGCDSDSVIITDINGKAYQIGYQENVGELLRKQNCPTGIVTITERNIYDEENSYQAVFINEAENTAAITISYYTNGHQEEQTYTQSDNKTTLKADAFSIANVKDELDPYTLVRVKKIDSKEDAEYYVADQESVKAWSDEGTYEVKVVNRLGYSYTLKVEINDSDYASLSFSGFGTEKTKAVITTYGAQNVALPMNLTRYGYDLIGYKDESGTEYKDQISKIVFKGTKVLTTVWKAKEYKLELTDRDGNTLKTETLVFGRKYDLPAPNLKKGEMFVGWAENGIRLQDNTYTLQSENDVTLVALIEKQQTASLDSMHPDEPEPAPRKRHILPWAAGIIAILVIAAKLRKKSASPENPISTSISPSQQSGSSMNPTPLLPSHPDKQQSDSDERGK